MDGRNVCNQTVAHWLRNLKDGNCDPDQKICRDVSLDVIVDKEPLCNRNPLKERFFPEVFGANIARDLLHKSLRLAWVVAIISCWTLRVVERTSCRIACQRRFSIWMAIDWKFGVEFGKINRRSVDSKNRRRLWLFCTWNLIVQRSIWRWGWTWMKTMLVWVVVFHDCCQRVIDDERKRRCLSHQKNVCFCCRSNWCSSSQRISVSFRNNEIRSVRLWRWWNRNLLFPCSTLFLKDDVKNKWHEKVWEEKAIKSSINYSYKKIIRK